MSERRRFNASERAALYLAADGRCASCGRELEPGWHADHVHPHSRGGDTDVTNGQALCPPCNLKKGSTPVTELREWQQEAIDRFYLHEKPDFLVSATPGAGKTTFALTLAGKLMADGTVRRVMVVVPTDALREQWADNAARFGLNLIPVREATDYEKDGYEGFVVTYQQLAMGAGADLARRATRVPTVAVLDEIHHAGDNRRWGDALRVAAGQAVHRIALTGTPWRRDKKEPIPFVQYGQDGTVVVDHPYEYGAAVADGVCRRIEFHAYDGEAKWVDHSRGRHEGVSATFTAQIGADMKDEDVSAALDAIYDPKHPWMPGVLEEAVVMLEDLRLEVPDAAGLVVAQEKWHAEAYADLLADLTGTRPPVVVSDPERDPGSIKAKAAIDRFRTGRDRWIVAVKMISEGVDIPRLAVGVYASKTQTPLFFRQVVGRLVRIRPGEEFNAKLLIPAVPKLIEYARDIETELRHQLDMEAQRERQERERGDVQTTLSFRETLGTSEASYDRAIFEGREIAPERLQEARARCAELGIPVQYAVNLLPLLGDGAARPTAAQQEAGPPKAATPRHRAEKMLRREVDALAGKVARRRVQIGIDSDIATAKKAVNAEICKHWGPRKKASLEELEAMRAYLQKTLVES